MSCFSSLSCIAVGSYLPVDADAANGDPDGDGQATHTLVEVLNDKNWKRLASPNDGRYGSVLSSISCVSSVRCIAVGNFEVLPTPSSITPIRFPLVESYNGKKWRIASGVPGTRNGTLLGVSCSSASRCIAVGYATQAIEGQFISAALIDTFDGHIWKADIAPTTSSSSELSAVACPTASSCVAVGNIAPSRHVSDSQPFIETSTNDVWNSVPLDTGLTGPGVLYDVACSTSQSCVAVGNATGASSQNAALVVFGHGTSWQVNASARGEHRANSLTTVACGASHCVTAGTTAPSIVDQPAILLANVGGALWQKISTADDAGFVRGSACPTATQCFFVGSSGDDVLQGTLNSGIWDATHSPVP